MAQVYKMKKNSCYELNLDMEPEEILDFCEELFGDVATFTLHPKDGIFFEIHDPKQFYQRVDAAIASKDIPLIRETPHGERRRAKSLRK